jgi:hypothetical protein
MIGAIPAPKDAAPVPAPQEAGPAPKQASPQIGQEDLSWFHKAVKALNQGGDIDNCYFNYGRDISKCYVVCPSDLLITFHR